MQETDCLAPPAISREKAPARPTSLASDVEALSIIPSSPASGAAAWRRLGQMAISARQYDAGAQLYSKAIQCEPKKADSYIDLGTCLGQLHKWDLAAQAHRQALRLAPDNFVAMANLGKALWRLNRPAEAIPQLRAALRLCPDLAFAHAVLGLSLLLTGQWQEGWEEYEWRLQINPGFDPKFNCPKWQGESIPGQTVLLCSEQGQGDSIQFLRYVPLVKARVGRVIVYCQDNLVRLAQTVAGADAVVPRSLPAPACDRYALLPSLPRVFGSTVDFVPRETPYFRVLHSVPRPKLKLQVGLVWAGNPENQDDFNRSMPLTQLAPLLAIPGIDFHSLQVGPQAAELANFAAGQGITDWAPSLQDYTDTAAALFEMDLLITVDTSAAHLAGALGRPVWTLLPFVADWRWLQQGSSTCWYPTMRLFRQPAARDWDSVVREVSKNLTALAAQHHGV